MVELFTELRTLDDVERHVTSAYSLAGQAGQRRRSGEVLTGPLALAVAEPGPLLEHAIGLAGPQGITRQDLRARFWALGRERWERGLKTLDAGGRVGKSSERRPNRAGKLQAQVVYRYLV